MAKVKIGQVRFDKNEPEGSETRRYIVGEKRKGGYIIRWPDDTYSDGRWTIITFSESDLEKDELDPDYAFYEELENL